jgi:hypothetical protein
MQEALYPQPLRLRCCHTNKMLTSEKSTFPRRISIGFIRRRQKKSKLIALPL